MIDICNMIENAIYMKIYGNAFLVSLQEKQKFVKSFINLVVTNSHLFLFAFVSNMTLMCIPVYNLQSYEYFRQYLWKFMP